MTTAIEGGQVIRVTIVGEGILIAFGMLWFLMAPEQAATGWSLSNAMYGVLVTIPLLCISGALHWIIHNRPHLVEQSRFLRTLRDFQRSTIAPICQNLTFTHTVIIAVLSGLGEELFFRGFLTASMLFFLPFWPALILVNVSFALIHFIGSMKELAPLIPLYIAAGFFFSFLVEFHGSMLSAIVAHGVFNLVSLNMNRSHTP